MIYLLLNCEKVLTDSGGLQKEAFFLKKPCITMREQTEWIETLKGGWNFITGTDKEKILKNIEFTDFRKQTNPFGNGSAGGKIIKEIIKFENNHE